MKHRYDPNHPDNIMLRQIEARREGVKKGEVMSEPTTEAGKELLNDPMEGYPLDLIGEFPQDDVDGWRERLTEHIAAIEQEARANADRELRELRAVADAARDLNMTMPDRGDTDPLAALDDALAALDAALEQKS